jgi:hypothetical protein
MYLEKRTCPEGHVLLDRCVGTIVFMRPNRGKPLPRFVVLIRVDEAFASVQWTPL